MPYRLKRNNFLGRLIELCSDSVNTAKQIHFYQKYSSPQESIIRKPQELSWRSVVGLEIHAQINAKSKLFSAAGTSFDSTTNTQVSYFDAALPGTLPGLNRCCVEAGIITALALNCTVHKTSAFDRKHYFYSDLPAGYQITQHFQPLATDGFIEFFVPEGNNAQDPKTYRCRSRLKQIQLEQDSGRSFHSESKKTFVDLNRAGIGLMELVFEPDLKNGLEAALLVKELQLILTELGTCTCAMEEGALRVDANISVHKDGEPWGVRTEVKNINSYRYIQKAVDFEIVRHIQVLEAGGIISNETRSFDFKAKETKFMRDKEEFQDYRFMPEPNLPPLQLCTDDDDNSADKSSVINIDRLREKIPPLPMHERERLMNAYKLSYGSADKLVKEVGLKDIFECATETEFDQEYVVLFLTNNVQHQLNSRKQNFKNCEVSSSHLKELIGLVQSKTISDATVNDVLEMLFNGDGRLPKEIVVKYNWFLISDEKNLEELCLQILKEMPNVAKKYRKTKLRKFMTLLLTRLNEKVNNRAEVKLAESLFIRLIMKPKDKESPKE